MTSNSAAARLPVLVNLDTAERITLDISSVSLGRAPDNTVILPDDGYASGSHARIYCQNNAWWIEDLMSSNGTAVNDVLIAEPRELAPFDVIKIGRTSFRIE